MHKYEIAAFVAGNPAAVDGWSADTDEEMARIVVNCARREAGIVEVRILLNGSLGVPIEQVRTLTDTDYIEPPPYDAMLRRSPPPEPREPAAREAIEEIENAYHKWRTSGPIWTKYGCAHTREREITTEFALAYSAELRAQRDKYQEWMNCGGAPTERVCSNPIEPNHAIFGGHFGNGDGTFTCEFHALVKVRSELQASERSLLQARAILSDYAETWKAAHRKGKCSRPDQCLVCRSRAALASTSAPEGTTSPSNQEQA